jgi:hypothetical protein
MKEKQLIILVYYINIDGLSRVQAQQQLMELMEVSRIPDNIKNDTNTEVECIYLPVRNQETKVECIFPKNQDENNEVKNILLNISEELKKFNNE